MPTSWDSYARSLETPRTCPICSKAASASKKVRPFCCVAHRSMYTREQKKLYHERFMATRAEVGEFVDNEGVVCCVKTATSKEVAKDKFKNRTEWECTFVTWCGREVEVPKPLKNATLNCIDCIAVGAPTQCRSPLDSTSILEPPF